MKKLLLLTISCFTCVYLIAQSISGTVEGSRKEPVMHATISLRTVDGLRTVKGELTDSLGRFGFQKVRNGRYTLEVTASGYKTASSGEINIDSTNSNVTGMTIKLDDDVVAMNEVKVTARKKLIEVFPDKLVMNIENSLVAVGNSAFDLLRKAPGVNIDAQEIIKLKGQVTAIYIDDKPAYISGEELLNYLKNLQADEISRIEIISNPGSRFPAQGAGGIINIKLKRNKRFGTNGSAGATLGYGKYPKLTGTGSLNYRNKKLNIFSGVSTGRYESYNQLRLNSTIGSGDKLVIQKRDNYWHPVTYYTSARAGLDYSLNKTSTLGSLARGTFSDEDANTTNSSFFTANDGAPQSLIGSTKDAVENNSNVLLNINYKKDIDEDGSSLNLDLDYGFYKSRSNDVNTNAFNNYTGIPRSPYVFRNITPIDVNIWSLKADWVRYIDSSLKIESGVKVSLVENDNAIIADSLQNTDWKTDAGRTNHFIYDENIYAGYFTVNKTLKRFSLQAGVRVEHTSSAGNSLTLQREDRRKYINLFPSLFTNYKIDSLNSISVNYTYRINRPGYQSLNPFVNFVDPYTYFEGNPFLRPSYSHSAEIKHAFRDFFYTSFGYLYSTNTTDNVILQDTVTKVSLSRDENVGTSHDWSFDISAGVPVFKWWNTDLSGGVAFSVAESNFPGYSYHTRAWRAYLSVSNSFTINKSIRAELSMYMNAPTRSGIARIAGSVNLSAGIQKQVIKDKGLLKFSFANFIGPTQYNALYRNDNLYIKWINKWEGKRASLSFSYKFGNSNVKASRQRRTASQEETNRVNL